VTLTERVKERAHALGFDLVGIAEARELPRDGARLAAWLAEDRHAGMAWMALHSGKRADPRALLPGCRSVLALAAGYWPGEEAAEIPEGRAKVALYARGRDYHRVLGAAARALAAWIAEETGHPARACVDTLPVLERAWAEASGLGWIGKNANLLTRSHGSWLMLAEVLTAAELVPDAGPHADFCGSCTACLDACPTGALVEPGLLDANACISYWTIEHRGPVPEERRAGNGDWIFGCDVCQEVCPWNASFAQPPGTPRSFGARPDLKGLDAVEILGMDEATFRARYSGTPLMRAKWEGMRRNACLVLGNAADPGDFRVRQALATATADPDPVVREHAAWALNSLERRTFSPARDLR
jgi:epoxyqueuosine reductase